MSFVTQKHKKKPPPRPPPPNFSKLKSKSTFNLTPLVPTGSLIEWSPPNSPNPEATHHFGGSVSSSFSSSTSSLASSKKSFDIDLSSLQWPVSQSQGNNGATFQSYLVNSGSFNTKTRNSQNTFIGPTIIRPKVKLNKVDLANLEPSGSLPMPSIPPPSPPKIVNEVETPYGIALYDYFANHPSDLSFQIDDVVILIRRINDDWLYGRVLDKEGMFPESFINVQVPLKQEANIVTALYDFSAQMPGDLSFKTGQKIKVTKMISNEWLYGEFDGQLGQFPSNYVNRVPKMM
ncbi:hypothetical protein ABEB36_010869 [Hypothenemus hampei]|uniref:SH3 domain-containing protein n=1 Tax=Hypothenemus hampei TaxID=57062 RepID=A0ABD1EDB7_HYPHA